MRRKQKPHRNPGSGPAQHVEGQKPDCKCDVNAFVRGEVAIVLPKDYCDAQVHFQKETSGLGRKQFTVSWLTLVAVVVYAGLTAWLAILTRDLVKTSQKTYEAANRPYVGVSDINVMYADIGPTGTKQAEFTPRPITDLDKMNSSAFMFDVEIKNYGTVPGENTYINRRTFLGGAELSTPSVPNKPSTIFPSQIATVRGVMGRNYYPAIMLGTKTLVLFITVTYDGPSHSYNYCVKEQFNPATKHFMNLGPICSP